MRARVAGHVDSKLSPLNLPNGSCIGGSCHIHQSTKPTTRPSGQSLAAGDVWYQAGTGYVWIWNGSVWLSQSLFILETGYWGTTSGTHDSCPVRWNPSVAYNIFVVDFSCSSYVANPNDGSNYWSFYLQYFNVSNAYTTIHSFNSNAGASGIWVPQNAAINTLYNVTALNLAGLRVGANMAGTAGTLFFSLHATYRLAYP